MLDSLLGHTKEIYQYGNDVEYYTEVGVRCTCGVHLGTGRLPGDAGVRLVFVEHLLEVAFGDIG